MATASAPGGSAPGAAAAARASRRDAAAGCRDAAVVGRDGLRGPAHPAVLHHPVAPLRLHDDQRRAAGLRRGGNLCRARAAQAAAALRAELRSGRRAVGITTVAGFALAQRVAFNPLEILWDPRQPLRLLVVYALLFVPFFCAASCICLTFTRFRGEAAPDLQLRHPGAGAGSLGILAALFVLAPAGALRLLGGLGLAAAALGLARGSTRSVGRGRAARRRDRPRRSSSLRAGRACARRITRSSRRRCASTARAVVAESSSPLGLVTVVESARVPFPARAGMSLAATMEPPPQLAVFTDGDGLSALTRYDGRREPLAYLDQLTSALPFHLLERPRVLVLGAGAGADVLQAIYHGARSVDAVELNPQIVDLVQRRFAEFSGAPYSAPGVRIPRRRGARLRRLARRSLRPDPGRAAGRVRRFVGGALRALGELPVHGRGAAGIPGASRARRHARDHPLGQSSAA